MNTAVDPRFVGRLIELGTSDAPRVTSDFLASASSSWMRAHHAVWRELAAGLSEPELVACIRAITVVEKMPGWQAGSVSPVIWLYKLLTQRAASKTCDAVADWVLLNTDNEFLPFGTSNYGAKSLSDLTARLTNARRKKELQQSLRSAERSLVADRKQEQATRRLFGALRRGDSLAIAALLGRGARIDLPNEDGITAMEYARSLGIDSVLRPSSDN